MDDFMADMSKEDGFPLPVTLITHEHDIDHDFEHIRALMKRPNRIRRTDRRRTPRTGTSPDIRY